MATLIYYTGNGYSCSCCRQSSTDYLDFDTPEEAIKECIEIASYNEWDFGIKDVRGYDGDVYELKEQIAKAVEQAEEDKDLRIKIDQVKKDIAHIENWFATLEASKATNMERLNKKRHELEELLK